MDVDNSDFYHSKSVDDAARLQRAPKGAGRSIDLDMVSFLIRAGLAVGLLRYLFIR
jgi:hypothetical protein